MSLINFKLWSQLNKDAEKEMKPDLGLKDWDTLTLSEKQKILGYLRCFRDKKSEIAITLSIVFLNENFKYKSYGKNYFTLNSVESARQDFENIFLDEKQHVVFEIISYFSKFIIKEEDRCLFYCDTNEAQEKFEERKKRWLFEEFDKFKEELNDTFEQFGVNVYLTRNGFVSRQDKKIIEEIYDPVLNFLSDKKWKEVNRELKDAFNAYQMGTERGYSASIIHSISAIEAFLQLSLYGALGKGTLNALIKDAIKKRLIPDDQFSNKIFDNTESILAQIRKERGDAHPKIEYANEKTARLILNITMIFLQHCIQM